MRIIKDTNIDFMRQRKLAFIISAVVILSGVISLLVNGGPKLSIDFKGGTLVSVQYNEDMDITAVRSAMGKLSVDGQDFETIKLILAKQRNGPTGNFQLAFRRQFTRFTSMHGGSRMN